MNIENYAKVRMTNGFEGRMNVDKDGDFRFR